MCGLVAHDQLVASRLNCLAINFMQVVYLKTPLCKNDMQYREKTWHEKD